MPHRVSVLQQPVKKEIYIRIGFPIFSHFEKIDSERSLRERGR
jgi:hypothetical protein